LTPTGLLMEGEFTNYRSRVASARKGPEVRGNILGHKNMNLAMDTHDRTTVQDFTRAQYQGR